MADSEDRRNIAVVQGVTPTNAYSMGIRAGDDSPWKEKPTLIQTPANNYTMPRESAPTSAHIRNPYDRQFSRRDKGLGNTVATLGFGNLTAQRTLTNFHPAKRQKTNNGYVAPTHGTSTGTTGGYTAGPSRPSRTKPPLAREPPPSRNWEHEDGPSRAATIIDVDADDDLKPNFSSSQDHQSSDQLDLIARPDDRAGTRFSKYEFRQQPRLVPQGEATKAMQEEFDSIESFSEGEYDLDLLNSKLSEGGVKGKVRAFEAMNHVQGPKLNLVQRMKAKQSKSAQQKFASIVKPALNTQDAVLTSSTPFINSKIEGIALKQVYIAEILYENSPGQEITMEVSTRAVIEIRQGVNNLISRSILYTHTVLCGPMSNIKSHPHIQFLPIDPDSPLITVWVDVGVQGGCEQALKIVSDLAKAGVKFETMRPTLSLWETARREAENALAETYPIETGDRMATLKRIEMGRKNNINLGPAQHPHLKSSTKRKSDSLSDSTPPLRYTPPPDRSKRSASTSKTAIASSSRVTSAPKDSVVQTRRSTRNRTQNATSITEEAKPKRTQAEMDTVLLTYPPGVPGALNITVADVDRLLPGEFLNDTLIEFGLKHWLKKLETTDPLLAEQVHVFNSFFYKKLNGSRDPQEAYNSVRKWTARIDLFKKKYVIVPINEHLHWYLAIIYAPEHVLLPQPKKALTLRPQTRSTITQDLPVEEDTSTAAETITAQSTNASLSPDSADADRSEAEVERSLNTFQSSCSIADHDKTPIEDDSLDDMYATPPRQLESVQTQRVSSPEEDSDYPVRADLFDNWGGVQSTGDVEVQAFSPTVSDFANEPDLKPNNPSPGPASPCGDAMVVDSEVQAASPSATAHQAFATAAKPTGTTVAATSFYSRQSKPKPKSKGKQRAKEPEVVDVDIEVGEGDAIEVQEAPKTHIFTFDSLGSRHPQAIKKLGLYLQMEAKDKRGIDDTGVASGKPALVPTQPNYCDCGVYLLHFAETFMKDPKKYCEMILSTKSKGMGNEERKQQWYAKEVDNKRTNLLEEIQKLSVEWKKVKEEAKKQEGAEGIQADSDSDMEFELVSTNIPSPKKGKKGSGGARAQKSGPAERMRG